MSTVDIFIPVVKVVGMILLVGLTLYQYGIILYESLGNPESNFGYYREITSYGILILYLIPSGIILLVLSGLLKALRSQLHKFKLNIKKFKMYLQTQHAIKRKDSQ